jgi:hypothetical protein
MTAFDLFIALGVLLCCKRENRFTALVGITLVQGVIFLLR